jgi:hypothetical protein
MRWQALIPNVTILRDRIDTNNKRLLSATRTTEEIGCVVSEAVGGRKKKRDRRSEEEEGCAFLIMIH